MTSRDRARDALAAITGVDAESPVAEAGTVATTDLVAKLDVQPDGEDRFLGHNFHSPNGRIFGGQVLAQSLAAAAKTVEADRPPHSFHGYFLRPGDPQVPIELAVERLRDGRSFSARRVQAVQHGKPILSMIASFQTAAEGLDHQSPMPEVPRPDEVPSFRERLAEAGHSVRGLGPLLASQPFELRHVQSPLFLGPGPEKTAEQAVWIRPTGPLPPGPLLHAVVLAYVSDYTVLEPTLRAHGLAWATPGMKTASLDHAMWFHRPARFDDWHLFVEESPSASGARGLGLARIYALDGTLVATLGQEGMFRVPE
ncbi:acyl-CoA thioesterase II [Kineosporia rhizophila]|uniref:acyl-CoA thioesterase n=1 Tax=Kineosporia TaxID=49184 RepID=UPI001E28B898|nr:acyl-CoA thioesterase II [Kineosporia sp. NBRC 101677]MCE0535624.1 acyl-CoA thioesterase II [Kineosporia rhizophila]GLY17731.1 acyl-CoA thioesterase II [Kineosporia sp. NBRC 101677]